MLLISYAEGHFVTDLPILFPIAFAVDSSITDLTFLFPICYAEVFFITDLRVFSLPCMLKALLSLISRTEKRIEDNITGVLISP